MVAHDIQAVAQGGEDFDAAMARLRTKTDDKRATTLEAASSLEAALPTVVEAALPMCRWRGRMVTSDEYDRLRAEDEAREAEALRRREEARRPGRLLEAGGFTRAASPRDFDILCKSVEAARAEGLGLLLAGGVGCGKTTAARALVAPDHGDFIPARELGAYRRRHDEADVYYGRGSTPLVGKAWVLDDLGTERVEIEYGNRVDYAADFLYECYERGWHKGGIVTTNFGADKLAERYGERLMSRILQVFAVVRLTGGDLRKRAPVFG